MNHWVAVPVVLPSLAAAFIILALRPSLPQQRIVSIGATLFLLATTIGLYAVAADGVPRAYLLGNWPAPFGIVLVLDRLSATMILLTAFLSLAVLIFAVQGWDRRGRHFHALFQFQLMGINGAFLTGDVFNLFVFFEVMLIASYGLLLHGGGPRRLRAGFHYVAINLVGSTLFLFAVGLIYATTGTLNMADLSVKVAAVAPGDEALLRTGILLLLMVFALKSAIAPLYWWLPTAYSAASAPAAALFAIMTKVGAYSIMRMATLVLGPEAGPFAALATPWILPAALVTLVVAAIAMLGSRTLLDLVCFAVIWSMGSLLVAIGLFDARGMTAAMFYVVHSTLAGATLFLLVDLVVERRGAFLDRLTLAPAMVQAGLVGGLFFLAAIAMAGMPPLSGFIGKLMVLDAARGAPWGGLVWATILATSLVAILAFSRAGSLLFWKSETVEGTVAAPAATNAWPVAVVGAMIGATALLTIFAGPATRNFEATAAQMLDRAVYVRAVLGPAALPR
ncbi:MAG TPA: monovalent cation/H+ antiporter subunit D [Beijerinckiaceae bacterium]|nr:monovalent cation/H+ antiporter subunit D [Beijerinckiaceae bacterium]